MRKLTIHIAAFASLILIFALSPSFLDAQRPVSIKELKFKHTKTEVKVQDTTTAKNTIKNIYTVNDIVYVVLDVKDTDTDIRLSVINMLAKEIKVIYEGKHTQQASPYIFNASSIPNGVYLCILQGKNFRDVKKFFISR